MQKKKNTRFYLFAGVMIVFAIILFKIGFTRLGQQYEKLSVCTKRITAVFKGYEKVKKRTGTGKSTTYLYPRYEYKYLGKQYRATSDYALASIKDKLIKGDRVTLFISPDSPEVFYVPSDNSGSVHVAYLFVCGAIFTVLAIVLILECLHEERTFKKHEHGYGYL